VLVDSVIFICLLFPHFLRQDFRFVGVRWWEAKQYKHSQDFPLLFVTQNVL